MAAGNAHLRQRHNSKSPARNKGKGDAAEVPCPCSPPQTPVDSSGSLSKKLLKLPLAIKFALALAAIPALAGIYWLSLYSGLVNPEAQTCTIPKFEYPWCANTLMHMEEVVGAKSSEEWLDLRRKYQDAIAKGSPSSESSLAEGWDQAGSLGFANNMESLEVRNLPGKGRSLHATQIIPRGTKIWDNRYRAVFPNACTAKHFLNGLTDQQKCDAVFWGYTNNFYGNGMQYMIDLDGHGYINHDSDNLNAIHHFEGEMETDLYPVPRRLLPWGGYLNKASPQWQSRNKPGAYGLYATRDIQVGEEILYDYDEIFGMGLFDWFTFYISRSLPVSQWMTI